MSLKRVVSAHPASGGDDGRPADRRLRAALDCRTAALVSREGSVDWLCFPRFDAPSVFCRLLDPAGGHFAIRPAGEFQASRRYVDQTMVLETTFTTAGGTAVLTDALTVGRNERGHDLGEHSPSMLARRLACTDGEIEAEVVYAPRPQYGDIRPRLFRSPAGSPHGEALNRCSWSPRSPSTSTAQSRPPGSGWPPGRPPSSWSPTGWPLRHSPRGARITSLLGWTTRWRAGGPGRRCTRVTTAPGGSLSCTPGECCVR